jgi:hypothetical protein
VRIVKSLLNNMIKMDQFFTVFKLKYFLILWANTLSLVGATYKRGFELDNVHTSLFAVTHALRFSVFTSHILATDLSHVKSSLHRLIPFLPFLLNFFPLSSPELDPIPILAAYNPRYVTSARSPQKTPSSLVTERVHSYVA